jgi:hypothetical protein
MQRGKRHTTVGNAGSRAMAMPSTDAVGAFICAISGGRRLAGPYVTAIRVSLRGLME